MFELGKVDDWRSRIGAIFGEQVAEQLIWVESEEGRNSTFRLRCQPDSQSWQHKDAVFVSKRTAQFAIVHFNHALGEAYRGLLLHGRFPVSFLRLDMPADQIDVNVHPTKLEVRFENGRRIYSQLLGTLRNRFLSTDLTAKVDQPADEGSSIQAKPQKFAISL